MHIYIGFARNNYWEYLGIVSDNDEVSVRFGLKDTQISPDARSAWPHSFRLTYTVTLTAKSLKTFIHLKNEDEDTFEFNTLLHTYFSVPVCRYVNINVHFHGLIVEKTRM